MDGISGMVKGFALPFKAFSVIRQASGLKRYVAIPLIINLLIFIVGFYLLWHFKVPLIEWIYKPLPVEGFLYIALWYIIAFLIFGLITLASYFVFTPLGCLVASPFNDALAGKTELLISGDNRLQEVSVSFGELINTIRRELGKLLLVGLVVITSLLLNLIPGLGTILSLFVSIIAGSWVFTMEYLDYPMSRHGYSFMEIAKNINNNLSICLGFGAGTLILLLVPLLNLICIPACVVGATLLFVELKDSNKLTLPKKLEETDMD